MSRAGNSVTRIILILLLVIPSFVSYSQAHRVQFGKNRIQYKFFDWEYYYSDNFEVYYYQGGEELAKRSIEYLESEFSRITETIGYPPYSKTRVFLYSSIADKQQSNVGVQGKDFTVGGQTNFVKSQVEIAYSGDYASFRKKLVYGVSDMLIQEMLFGGNIAEMFQTTFSAPIPRWFTSGISAYIAYGWDKDSDDVVREYVQNNLTDKFVRLSPEANVLIGQSIWNFIVQRYGQRSVANILNLARIIRNEENSIGRTLGLPFDRFMSEWRGYYSNIQTTLLETYVVPDRTHVVSGKNNRSASYTSIQFSPDGNLLAYAAMDRGKYNVNVINLANGKEITLFKGGIKLLNQEIDTELPLISWADETTLGVVTNEQGRNTLTIKRVGSRGQQQIQIPRLSRIQSFNFKYKGRLAVLTGDLDGKSDVFIYNINRSQIRRVTNDNFDDRDASFIPETNTIVFSSNRNNDSIQAVGPLKLEDSELHKFNVYEYDLETLDSTYTRLTNALAMDRLPLAVDLDQVFYVSDQQGINNLYRYSIADSISSQVTGFIYGIKSYTIDYKNNRIAYVSTVDSKDAVLLETFSPNQSLFTPITPRRAQETTKILAEIRRKRLLDNQATGTDSITDVGETIQRVLTPPSERNEVREGAINTEKYEFETQSKVDTRNYKFERPTQNQPAENRSFLSIYQNSTVENKVRGPEAYENRFTTNNVVTTFVIDEIRSFSQLMEIQMNDFLENHRFYGGLLIPYNFNSGFDAFGEYQYLKYRVDLHAKYMRKSIQREDPFFRQRTNLNRFEIGAALPASPYLRFEVSPFYTQTQYLDLNPNLLVPNPQPNIVAERKNNYYGVKAALVYDNSFVAGTNIHEGTRAKVVFEAYNGISGTAGFNNIEIDVRHYQRLAKGVYAAARIFYGSFFGDAPKRYLLGGVDNWAFNKTQTTGDETDPLLLQDLLNDSNFDNSDLVFTRFTNLRGYDYNTFQGRNVLTFSGELRFPVSQVLNNKESRSNFLRNLQFIGFYDIGSSWDDLSPFREQNNLNIEEIEPEGSPFSAVINNFNNPWLQSTGVGVRTMLFGFFSRLDFSWPIQNFEVQSPRLQVSIGYDF